MHHTIAPGREIIVPNRIPSIPSFSVSRAVVILWNLFNFFKIGLAWGSTLAHNHVPQWYEFNRNYVVLHRPVHPSACRLVYFFMVVLRTDLVHGPDLGSAA